MQSVPNVLDLPVTPTIVLNYSDLKGQSFITALQKVVNTPIQNVGYARRLGKLAHALTEKSKVVAEEYRALVQKFAHLDDKGEVAFNEEGVFTIRDEVIADWEKAKEDFDKYLFITDIPKFPVEAFQNCQLTPLDFNALELVLQ